MATERLEQIRGAVQHMRKRTGKRLVLDDMDWLIAEIDRRQPTVDKLPRQPNGDYLQCPLCRQYLDADGTCPEGCGDIGQWLANYAKAQELIDIVEKLPKDGDGNVYPPPRALQDKVFYHPKHLGAAPLLFTQLFWWHPKGCWGVGCGGWEVPLAECYDTCEAAEAAKEAAP